MTMQARPVTAEELFALPDDGMRRELIAGELRTMPPAGDEHGETEFHATLALGGWLRAHPEFRGYAGDPGFRIARDPDTVRAPDVAIIRRSRLPEGRSPIAFGNLAPDLVLEIVSPGDAADDVRQKTNQWLQAGCLVVLELYPTLRQLEVRRQDGRLQSLASGDTLDLSDLFPGLSLPVQSLFPPD